VKGGSKQTNDTESIDRGATGEEEVIERGEWKEESSTTA